MIRGRRTSTFFPYTTLFRSTGKDLPGKLQLPRGRQLKKGRLFLLSFFRKRVPPKRRLPARKLGNGLRRQWEACFWAICWSMSVRTRIRKLLSSPGATAPALTWSDSRLVQECLSGDEQAWAEVFGFEF